VILTSVEFDHADIYKDLDAVETAFKRLVNLVPRRGRIVAFDSGASAGSSLSSSLSSSIDRCLKKAFCPVERYGALVPKGDRAGWRIANLQLGEEQTSWSVMRDGKPWADFEFALGGEYNVWNATAAAALAANCEISKDVIAKALRTFRSVKRRLEVKAEVNGITIIDDFAHHPTAIEQTILALRARYPQSRLWVVLEPRSNTMRRNVLQDALARSLALADQVVVADIFKSEAIPAAERLDLNRVVDAIQKHGKQARIFADADAIVNAIAPELRERDVVAILSNGGFGGIYEKLPQRLRGLGVQAFGVKT
jgi:UDP-N-acetylmuramate: L-alanyl-gamma-D-glutamyl-meso-diaminopimelate ligase